MGKCDNRRTKKMRRRKGQRKKIERAKRLRLEKTEQRKKGL